jgi:hypothetical protein
MAFVNDSFTFKTGTAFADIVKIKVEEEKPQVPKRKYNLTTEYTVAGRNFAEYITRRMMKDGIGFAPIDTYQESSTDLYGYIRAPVPKNDADFAAYCHELGHCKSRQFHDSYKMFNATWGGKWAKERLVSEVNAWKWGIRYMKRLGYKITEEIVKVVQWSLKSYFVNAEDEAVAHNLAREFEQYSGIKIETREKPVDFSMLSIYTEPKEIKKTQPDGWKPWHDLKAKQIKKAWRHQK